MPTVTDIRVIQTIIDNHGIYPGDEDLPIGPAVRIVRYYTPDGQPNWGVVYESEAKLGTVYLFKYENSPSCLYPLVIYRRAPYHNV